MLILAGVGAGPSGDYQSIATTTVGAGGASTITFSSIPSTYKHLQVRALAKGATSDATGSFTFNSDTATNYSWHIVGGQGTVTSSAASTSSSSMKAFGYNRGLGGTGDVVFVIDILDYADANKYKTIRSLWGVDSNGTGEVALVSGNWRSTSAVTSMVFTPSGGTFSQYTHFALYGIKG
jgi:hypothetical protein